jgi:hypothetical protein
MAIISTAYVVKLVDISGKEQQQQIPPHCYPSTGKHQQGTNKDNEQQQKKYHHTKDLNDNKRSGILISILFLILS